MNLKLLVINLLCLGRLSSNFPLHSHCLFHFFILIILCYIFLEILVYKNYEAAVFLNLVATRRTMDSALLSRFTANFGFQGKLLSLYGTCHWVEWSMRFFSLSYDVCHLNLCLQLLLIHLYYMSLLRYISMCLIDVCFFDQCQIFLFWRLSRPGVGWLQILFANAIETSGFNSK